MTKKYFRLAMATLTILCACAQMAFAAPVQRVTTLGINNVPPAFTSGPSDSGSSWSTPTNAGSLVTFTATASDPNSDNYYVAICKTPAITPHNGSAPTCDGGSWGSVSAATVSGTAITPITYTTLSGDAESNDWYAYACDGNGTTNNCSAATQGSGTAITAIEGGTDSASSIAFQTDGKLVVAGVAGTYPTQDFALARYNTDGTLDTSFGTGGKVTTSIGADNDYIQAMAIQTDGKIVAAGWTRNSVSHLRDYALARYNIDGSLDGLFGTGGKVVSDIGSYNDQIKSVAIQSDGKIVVAGNSDDVSGLFDFSAARYNTDGSLDNTFNSNGKVITPVGSGESTAFSVVIQGNGKIVAAGSSGTWPATDFAMVRYNSDGTLDTAGFGSPNGYVTTAIGSGADSAYSLAIQTDGKLVLGGPSDNGSNDDFAVARYNTDGSLDTAGFGSGTGKVTTDIGNLNNSIYSIAIQSNGKIVAAGQKGSWPTLDFAVARYNTDGSLDTGGFGSGGIVTTDFGVLDAASSVAVASSGKIVVVGQSGTYPVMNFALIRYNTDGTPDSSFGGNGSPFKVNHTPALGVVAIGSVCGTTASVDPGNARSAKMTTAIGNGNDQGRSVIIQPDGRVVVAGSSHNGSNNDFAMARYNADGALDTTFDSDGKATTAFGTGNDGAFSVALQSDGKIVAAGTSYVSGSGLDFAMARYNADGALDTTFDSDGKATTAFGTGTDMAYAVAIQPDGKIVAGGKYDSSVSLTPDFGLARYNSDGSLDTGFGTSGIVQTDMGDNDAIKGIVLQSDGKIAVAGSSGDTFALARYNADGTLDSSFGTNGKVYTAFGVSDIDAAESILLQPDGKIVAIGYTMDNGWTISYFSLARYNPNGSLDSSFGTGGKITTIVGLNGLDNAYKGLLQTDGKIVASGDSWDGANNDLALVRYNADGSLDTSFGTGGKVMTAIGSGNDSGYASALQPDGKVVQVGETHNGSNFDFALVRYKTSGSLDDLSGYACAQTAVTDGDADTSADTVDVHVCSTNSFTGTACAATTLCSITGVKNGQSAQCVMDGQVPIPTAHGSFNAYVFTVDGHGFQGTGTSTQSYSVTDMPPTIGIYAVNDINPTAGGSVANSFTVLVSDNNGWDDVEYVEGFIYDSNALALVDGYCDSNDRSCYQHLDCPRVQSSSTQLVSTCSFTTFFNINPTSPGVWKAHANAQDTLSFVTNGADSATDITVASLSAMGVSENTIAYGATAAGGTSAVQPTTLQNMGNLAIDVGIHGSNMVSGSENILAAQQHWASSSGFSWGTDDHALVTSETVPGSADQGCANRSVAVRENHTSVSTDSHAFWKLKIPSLQPTGTYVGTNTFTSIADGLCTGSDGPAAVCGNGQVEDTEGCDDGGTAAGDGCSGTCTIETGYFCVGFPSACQQGITYGGENYPTFTIAITGHDMTQTWFKKNLNIGTRIAGAGNQSNNSTIEKYCYNDSDADCDTYGGLYQWDEAMGYGTAEGAQGICPEDFNIPTDSEWNYLITELGGSGVAGGAMKESGLAHWDSPNTGANNSSGFTALGTGHRETGGTFTGRGTETDFWSSLASGGSAAVDRTLQSDSAAIGSGAPLRTQGFPVRCVKTVLML